MRFSVSQQWFQWPLVFGFSLLSCVASPSVVLAQAVPAEIRDPFLADPELTEPRDPLLPELPVSRRLSPLEQSELRTELDLLAVEAEQLYLEGQTELAFQIWMREVRLRRVLGYAEEIQAMQRVGLRAWENSRTQESQLLTLRLEQVQADLLSQEPLDIDLLEAVAATFEVLRDIDGAIATYETLIVQAAQAGRRAERQQLLENLANLQENWFRFEVAGKTYQSLLSANTTGDPVKQTQYLQGAIRNYQDANQLRIALEYQRRLLAQYEATATVRLIPALQLAIARNYRDVDDLTQAQNAYLTTYSTALALNQTDVASEAVEDLANIYLDSGQTDDVLYLYRQQLALERQSYNAYGLMAVFDRIGQFYESQDDPDAAIRAYQEGLILADQLGDREAYFNYRLLTLLYEQGRLTVTPAERHQGSVVGNLQRPRIWRENGRIRNSEF